MTQFQRFARSSLLAATAACVFAVALTGLPAVSEAKKAKTASQPAQGPQQGADDAQKQQAAEAARKAYDAGLKEFANGRYQPAIEQLSTALKGSLTAQQTAKALYTRGIAYKKQNKPGLAISDLTSALWLKNGLIGKERETATAERSEAYKMAGIQDTGKGAEHVVADTGTNSGPNAGSAGLSAAAIAQAAASSKSGTTEGSGAATPITRQDASSESAQDAARARAAYAPVDGLAASTVTTTSTATAPAQTSSFGSGVTGFFSNLFGGSSPAPTQAAEPAAVTTASTSPAVPETLSWSNATVVNEHKSEPGHTTHDKHSQTAAVTPPPATPRATKGKYKVHIAALRSRAEAEALAQKLVAQHGAELDNHVPTVDEAVIGSMGTFYRVRIGGYASQEEPRGLCNKLRTSGLDCLVVTN
jgi:hypothetical protein